MNIGTIDRSATSGSGWLHDVAPPRKLTAFALVLAAIVVTWNIFLVAAIALGLLAVAVSCRLDLRLTLLLAGYPAIFALIFAWASAPGVMAGTVIVLKAVCAALAAVIVVLTTPYPQIFAPIQRIVPEGVGDALLMTYRSAFLLLGKFENVLRAVRLRAGLRGTHPVRTGRATTQALGGVLVYSFDLAQRDYDIMWLRGYSGRLRVAPMHGTRPRLGWALVVVALATLAVSIVWRLDSGRLNPYSWLLPIPALLLLAAGWAVRWRTP